MCLSVCLTGRPAFVSRHDPQDKAVDNTYKVKLSLCLTKHHAMKTYWGSGDIAPGIL